MPSEIVTSIKHGKKKSRVRKLYPYLFVNMDIFANEDTHELNADAYYFITSINGVTFIGGKEPVQLSNSEIDTIKSHIKSFETKEVPKSFYEVGQKVTILDGLFVGLHGEIGEADVAQKN